MIGDLMHSDQVMGAADGDAVSDHSTGTASAASARDVLDGGGAVALQAPAEDCEDDQDAEEVRDADDLREDAVSDDPFASKPGIEEFEDESSLSEFEGDEGNLPLARRQCLVLLLKQHMLTAERHPREWATLLSDSRTIKASLNDLFLDLVLDRERGVAYKVQVRSDVAGRFPPLLRDTSYSREETILLIYLRTRYRSERSSGLERIYVDRQECLDNVAGFRPASATNVTGDTTKASNAVDSLKGAGVLMKTPVEDRFEVSPVIEALLPLDKLHALLEWFIEENRPRNASADPERQDLTNPDLTSPDVTTDPTDLLEIGHD